MADKVEVHFSGVGDDSVYDCACWHVLVFAIFIFSPSWEEACVMSFLYHEECDTRFVVLIQACTCSSYSGQLWLQNLCANICYK